MLYPSANSVSPYSNLDYFYLDYMASTPMCEAAIQSYKNQSKFANGQSSHRAGMESINSILSYSSREYLMSGLQDFYCANVSEGIRNLMLWFALSQKKIHILVSKVEHKCILDAIDLAISLNPSITVTWLANDSSASINMVDLDLQLSNLLYSSNQYVLLFSQSVNNELGTIQPLEAIRQSIWKNNSNLIWICDSSQSWSKAYSTLLEKHESVSPDITLVSGHKFYGPKSAAMVKVNTNKVPYLSQSDIHSGTLDIQAISALYEAEQWCVDEFTAKNHTQQLNDIRSYLHYRLKDYIGFVLSPGGEYSVPWCSMVYMSNIVVNDFILGTNSVMVSSGSACAKFAPSHVLEACQYDPEWIKHCMRISWDPLWHDMKYIEKACDALIVELETYLDLYK